MDMQWKRGNSLVRSALGLGLGVGLLLTATPSTAKDEGCAWFDGLEHCPLAASALYTTNEGLVVKSEDGKTSGVRIDTGDAATWDAWLSPLEPDFDSQMTLTFIGALPEGGTEVSERVVVTRSRETDLGAIYVDPSVHGATSYTVRGYNGGKLVFERSHVEPVQEKLNGLAGPGNVLSPSRLLSFPGPWSSSHGVIGGDGGCTPSLDFPFPRPIRFPDGRDTLAVDLVTFKPEGVSLKSRALREVSFEAVGMESFTIRKEARTP